MVERRSSKRLKFFTDASSTTKRSLFELFQKPQMQLIRDVDVTVKFNYIHFLCQIHQIVIRH